MWWKRPWVIALALATAGIVGAVSVAILASRVHERDRQDIVAFEREMMPWVLSAQAAHARLGRLRARPGVLAESDVASQLSQARADLQRARRELQDPLTPKILQNTMAAYLSGVGFTLDALASLERAQQSGARTLPSSDAEDFDASWATAQQHFERGAELYDRLRARARLDEP